MIWDVFRSWWRNPCHLPIQVRLLPCTRGCRKHPCPIERTAWRYSPASTERMACLPRLCIPSEERFLILSYILYDEMLSIYLLLMRAYQSSKSMPRTGSRDATGYSKKAQKVLEQK